MIRRGDGPNIARRVKPEFRALQALKAEHRWRRIGHVKPDDKRAAHAIQGRLTIRGHMGKLSKTFFYHNKRTIQVRQSPHSWRQDPGRNGAGRKDHATGVEGAGTIRVPTFWMSIQRQITEAKTEASAAGLRGLQANLKIDGLQTDLSDFRIYAEKEFREPRRSQRNWSAVTRPSSTICERT
ncbi:hypothetical protein [Tardiphaga sp. 803_E3_N1_3]|uniref:hypothetical protein n=1 Tax=Tardiphaga sp. 803_E3_N1_3 TaxID=3240785 RepID=UPI003F2352E1